ncbi:MAG: 30S ribosomal protein S21 [Spirochaetes bacterium]|nr:MAG: 30S ribosomal protein S21 [Spirochaetota bacterium]
MAVVYVEEGESIDKALKRFKRECEREGILREWKKRAYYEKPAEQRKNKKKAAERKRLKKLRKMQMRINKRY